MAFEKNKSMAFDKNTNEIAAFENKIKFIEMKQKINDQIKKETRSSTVQETDFNSKIIIDFKGLR